MRLILGDSAIELKRLPDNSIDAIVTDPPYGLSFMGKEWDYEVPPVSIWKECLRVLRPGGHILCFAGTRTQHRMAVNIEDAGFEIRDMLQWVYGSGFPKSHNLKDDWEGWGTALKPAHEPITLARKPLLGTVAKNVQQYGTGALNIDACRIEGEPWKWGTQTDIKGGGYGSKRPSEGDILNRNVESNPLGRWPANLIHDGSDEVLNCFPDAPGQLVKAKNDGSDNNNAVYSAMKCITTNPEPRDDIGKSAARFFYCAKASKSDRNEGCEDLPQRTGGMVSNTSGQHITRRDEGYQPKPQGNNHPTVKPTALMRWLCRLITQPGGIVLDPYMGSGSTGKAALLEGFDFIGIEMNPEYFDIATARVKAAEPTKEVKNEAWDLFSPPNEQ